MLGNLLVYSECLIFFYIFSIDQRNRCQQFGKLQIHVGTTIVIKGMVPDFLQKIGGAVICKGKYAA